MSDEFPEQDYELQIPFVECVSRGGRYDDESFVAGFAMGSLHRLLTTIPAEVRQFNYHPIYKRLLQQSDLIAMHFGWECEIFHETDHWVTLTFTRNK